MVCEPHFDVKTAILVIAINPAVQGACETTCQIVAWYEHGQHCSAETQRLRLCTTYWHKKQNKTKLGGSSVKSAD